MTNTLEEPPTKVASAIKVIADEMGCSADELAFILNNCNDRIEGECVLARIAKYKQAEYSGWVALNLKDGNATELRANPDVRGGIVTLPESHNPFRKYLEQYCKNRRTQQ